jgi:hypothetical protein
MVPHIVDELLKLAEEMAEAHEGLAFDDEVVARLRQELGEALDPDE